MTKFASILRENRPFFLATLVIVSIGGLYSQTSTATLAGTVRDASNAVVAQAQVTLTNSSTGISRKVESDGQGRYIFSNVEPGQYDLSVEHPGFKTALQRGVLLTVGGSAVVDFTLELGAVSESVTVSTAAPIIDPSSVDLSRVVDEQTIESLPNLGRNFVDFAELSTGVTTGRENEGGGAFKEPDTGVGQAAAPRLSFGGQPSWTQW